MVEPARAMVEAARETVTAAAAPAWATALAPATLTEMCFQFNFVMKKCMQKCYEKIIGVGIRISTPIPLDGGLMFQI